MTTPNQNSAEILRAEILADARREGGEIIHRAQQEAEALLARAGAEAEEDSREQLAAARAEAVRRRELILATLPVEAGRLRAARVEALLESVHEEVRRRLAARQGFDYREAFLVLAAEAIGRMAGCIFTVKHAAADRGVLGEELAGEIARRVGRASLKLTIACDASVHDGCLIITDGEGRQLWDNSLGVRLERLWPELRRQIAIQTSLVLEPKTGGGGE